MRYALLARAIRGVEDVAAAEIEATLWPRSLALGHRSVRFRAPVDPSLLELGTVDDVFLVALRTGDIGSSRAALRAVARLGGVEGGTLLATVRRLREVRGPLRFDVVASFLGRRNFNRFELADAVGAALSRETGWEYLPRSATRRPPDAPLSFRLDLDGEAATLGLRLAARPLHRRRYRVVTRPGSLHPPLARALASLACVGPGSALLDPCCGAGTIAIEALLAEPRLRCVARDLDPGAVAAAARNARAAGAKLDLAREDAARLRLPGGSFDAVVCNPPWGRASSPRGGLAADPGRLWREIERLLVPGGRVAVVMPVEAEAPGRLSIPGLRVEDVRSVRVAGAEAEVVIARRERAHRGSSRAAT